MTLTIENSNKTAIVKFDPTSIVVLGPDGRSYMMLALKNYGDELKAQTLKPGAKIQGAVVYEVPIKFEKWTLDFNGGNNQTLLWNSAG